MSGRLVCSKASLVLKSCDVPLLFLGFGHDVRVAHGRL